MRRSARWYLGVLAVLIAVTIGIAAAAVRAPVPRTSPGQTGRYLVTEYFPVPERWFQGRPVSVPGIPARRARQDFLWSPTGAAMEFDGVLTDGTRIHFANDEGVTWVNQSGNPTLPRPNGRWSNGPPAWRDVGWRNANGAPTFPKIVGGWSHGRGVHRESSPPRFALGPSEKFLHYWRTAAVDPHVIPPGSRIYVPRFKSAPNHGWWIAQDTGSTIIGRQIDLYVPPPHTRNPSLEFAGRLSVTVFPPAPAT